MEVPLLLQICMWWLFNALATIYSKRSVIAASSDLGDSGALLLTLAQHTLTSALFQAYCYLSILKKDKVNIDLNKALKWFPAGFFHAIGVWATNKSLTHLSAGETQAVKGLEPLCLYMFSLYIMPRDQSCREIISTIASILLAVTGTGIFVFASQHRNPAASDHTIMELLPGIFFAGVSCLAFPLRNLWIKYKISTNGHTSPLWKMTFVSAWGMALTAPCVVVQRLYWYDSFRSTPLMDTAMSSVFHGLYHCTSVVILDQISPLLHSMLGVFKRIFVIILSTLYFGRSITQWEGIGLNFFMLGFLSHKATVSSAPSLKIAVKVALLLLVVNITFSQFYPGNQIIEQTPVEREEISLKTLSTTVQTDVPITLAWVQEQPLSNGHIHVIKMMAPLGRNVQMLCGSSACMKKVERMGGQVNVSQVDLTDLFHGLPALERWLLKHPLHKVLAKEAFEESLAEAVKIASLWKFGGLYIGLNYKFDPNHVASFLTNSLPSISLGASSDHSVAYVNVSKSEVMLRIAQKFAKSSPPTVQGLYEALPTIPLTALHQLPSQNMSSWRYSALTYNVRIKHVRGIANLGDEVQSFAGLQYLPYVDCLTERDAVVHNSCTKGADDSRPIITFFNAWWGSTFMEWPPPSHVLPIFASVHAPAKVVNKIWRHKVSYLKKHEPIGCRDTNTLDLIRQINVSAYFSGCLTLMMQNPVSNTRRADQVYIVDVLEHLVRLLPKRIQTAAIRIHHGKRVTESDYTETARFEETFSYLSQYGSAQLVITSRIHAALPAASMGTPVVFFNAANMPGGGGSASTPSARVAGLTDLFHTMDMYHTKETDLLREKIDSFNWDNPPPNPNPGLMKRIRAAFWDVMRQFEPIQDAAIKFGTLPRQLPISHFGEAPLLFHLVASEMSGSEKDLTALQWQSVESVLYHHPNSRVTVHTESDIDLQLFDSLQESGYSVMIQKHARISSNFIDDLTRHRRGIYLDMGVLNLRPLHTLLEQYKGSAFTIISSESSKVLLKQLEGEPSGIVLQGQIKSLHEDPVQCEDLLDDDDSSLYAISLPPSSKSSCLRYLFEKFCILCNRVHSRLK